MSTTRIAMLAWAFFAASNAAHAGMADGCGPVMGRAPELSSVRHASLISTVRKTAVRLLAKRGIKPAPEEIGIGPGMILLQSSASEVIDDFDGVMKRLSESRTVRWPLILGGSEFGYFTGPVEGNSIEFLGTVVNRSSFAVNESGERFRAGRGIAGEVVLLEIRERDSRWRAFLVACHGDGFAFMHVPNGGTVNLVQPEFEAGRVYDGEELRALLAQRDRKITPEQ